MKFRGSLAIGVLVFALISAAVLPWSALAGDFEVSGGFSFTKTTYEPGSFTWSRRWGASLGYYLWELTEIELSYQDITSRNLIQGSQDITYHDQVYSLNWVQNVTSKNFPVQPYFKLGIGQLERKYSGSYANGAQTPVALGSLTAVIGVGARIYFTRQIALRSEITSYLQGASLRTLADNFGFTVGLSVAL